MARLKGNFNKLSERRKVMAEGEVDVKFEPFKEIVIMERNFFASPEDIARFASIIAGGKTAGLYWAEGVVFLYFPLPASTETAAKVLVENKRVYWTFVGYAPMPKYQPLIETREKIIVPVIDMSSNPMFRKIANWLKEQGKTA
ncbi:MAG: hypothetical protein QXG76_00600 [Candidatus Bathyarchaeia archaeon]